MFGSTEKRLELNQRSVFVGSYYRNSGDIRYAPTPVASLCPSVQIVPISLQTMDVWRDKTLKEAHILDLSQLSGHFLGYGILI